MDFIKIEERSDYIIASLDRPKVNALNHQLVEEIRSLFKDVSSNDEIKGVVLTGQPGVFSAGLDVIELYSYDHDKMNAFLESFGLMYHELARFPKPFVCAINGHCPAGGTVIAVMADYRVMVDNQKYGIGLNEVAVNVQISKALVEAYSFWLGRSEAYRNIMEGRLLSPQEAFDKGLVNKLVASDELIAAAEKQMRKYLTSNEQILLNTKAKLRSEWLDNAPLDPLALKQTAEVWWDSEVRAKMKMFVDMLQSKEK